MIEEKCQLIIHLFEQQMQKLELKLENKCDEMTVVKSCRTSLKKSRKKKNTPSWADVVKKADTRENTLAFHTVLTN